VVTAVLQRLGLQLETVQAEVKRALAKLPKTLVYSEVPFSPQAKQVLERSKVEARQLGHNYIGTEHLLLCLMRDGQSIAAKSLEVRGARLDEVRRETVALLSELGAARDSPGAMAFTNMPLSPEAKRVPTFSMEEASRLGHQLIGAEHLLVGIMREEASAAAKTLRSLGVRLDDVRPAANRTPRRRSRRGDVLPQANRRWRDVTQLVIIKQSDTFLRTSGTISKGGTLAACLLGGGCGPSIWSL